MNVKSCWSLTAWDWEPVGPSRVAQAGGDRGDNSFFISRGMRGTELERCRGKLRAQQHRESGCGPLQI